jgi:hypothetical protein
LSLFLFGGTLAALASNVFQVDVKMVMVSFTVKDEHGRYVSGLTAKDICLREDNARMASPAGGRSGFAGHRAAE